MDSEGQETELKLAECLHGAAVFTVLYYLFFAVFVWIMELFGRARRPKSLLPTYVV